MTASRHFASALAIALAAAGVSGCATSTPPLHSGLRAPATAVRIRNDNWLDVRVYLVSANGSRPIRIGMVTSMTTTVIPLKGAIASQVFSHGSLQFLLRPIGSRVSYTTYAVYINPGTVTELTVANQLEHSTLMVRSR